MDITIDHDVIEKAINEQINAAVVSALGGYDVQKAISATITEDVANGLIAGALRNALSKLDTATLTLRLAEEIQRAMTGAVVHLLHRGLAETLVNISGKNLYSRDRDDEVKRVLAEIRAQEGRS